MRVQKVMNKPRSSHVALSLGVVMLATASIACSGYRDNLGVTDYEIAQLPRFCWVQMESKLAKGPAFDIPPGCGPGMNHYCPALVHIMRARGQLDMQKRNALLTMAEKNVLYTLKWMEPYPNCPIRTHVEQTKTEIEALRRTIRLGK
jgi:hypothetical protein